MVSVNGSESRIVFIDHEHGAMKLENMVVTYTPHAFLVVMAVDNAGSLLTAEHILLGLKISLCLEDKAVILVANKTDLVRNREVKSGMGKQLAVKYGVKYIETSPGT